MGVQIVDLKEKNCNTKRHPWELARKDIILGYFLKQGFAKTIEIVDIGSGDLYFTNELSIYFPNIDAVDIGYIDEMSENIRTFNSIQRLSDDYYDVIFLMDVLEHIEYDVAFLESITTKLKKGGRIYITAPSLKFVYSNHDKFLEHYRRYSLSDISNTINNSNLRIRSYSFFFNLLVLPRLIILLLEKVPSYKVNQKIGVGYWPYDEKHIFTQLIRNMLKLDAFLLFYLTKYKIYLPGLSIFVEVEKPI